MLAISVLSLWTLRPDSLTSSNKALSLMLMRQPKMIKKKTTQCRPPRLAEFKSHGSNFSSTDIPKDVIGVAFIVKVFMLEQDMPDIMKIVDLGSIKRFEPLQRTFSLKKSVG